MGWLSSLLWLGVVLGYSFVLGVRPPNLLNARVRRGRLSAEFMKKLANCRPHEHVGGGSAFEEAKPILFVWAVELD